jgi:hypothetical protein
MTLSLAALVYALSKAGISYKHAGTIGLLTLVADGLLLAKLISKLH